MRFFGKNLLQCSRSCCRAHGLNLSVWAHGLNLGSIFLSFIIGINPHVPHWMQCTLWQCVLSSRIKLMICPKKGHLVSFQSSSTATQDGGEQKLGNYLWHNFESITTKVCIQKGCKWKAIYHRKLFKDLHWLGKLWISIQSLEDFLSNLLLVCQWQAKQQGTGVHWHLESGKQGIIVCTVHCLGPHVLGLLNTSRQITGPSILFPLICILFPSVYCFISCQFQSHCNSGKMWWPIFAAMILQCDKSMQFWSNPLKSSLAYCWNRVTVKIWSQYLQYLQSYLEIFISHFAAAVPLLETDNISPVCRYII